MTNEEAIKMLKQWNEDLLPYEDEKEGIECHNIAISALEKQIPTKPLNIEETKYKVSYKCPVCGTLHVNNWCGTEWKLPFCSMCGQALDWSDSE